MLEQIAFLLVTQFALDVLDGFDEVVDDCVVMHFDLLELAFFVVQFLFQLFYTLACSIPVVLLWLFERDVGDLADSLSHCVGLFGALFGALSVYGT